MSNTNNLSESLAAATGSAQQFIDRLNAEAGQRGGYEGLAHGLADAMLSGAREGMSGISGDMAFRASAGALAAFQPTLCAALYWIRFATATAGIVSATATLVGVKATSHLKRLGIEMAELNNTVRALHKEMEISTNFEYARDFPQLVHNFISFETSKAAAGRDLEAINTHNMMERIRILQGGAVSNDPPPCNTATEALTATEPPPQYFFVYHPGSDWHAGFNNLLQNKPIPGLVGTTNNLNLLTLFLGEFRTFVGAEAVIKILFPSAHTYVIAGILDVPETMHPLRMVGQTNRSGNPFVHICARGIKKSQVADVGTIFLPLTTWQRVKVNMGTAGAVVVGYGGVIIVATVMVPIGGSEILALGALGTAWKAGKWMRARMTRNAQNAQNEE